MAGVIFDSSLLQKEAEIPRQFVWPPAERPHTLEELEAPVVDVEGFFKGDEDSTRHAAELVRTACSTHGFFQVTNHGVIPSTSFDALGCIGEFFTLPIDRKLNMQKRPGSMWGYAGAHTDRFSSRLPWKETLSLAYHEEVNYVSVLGKDFEKMGLILKRYCRAMKELALAIMELLGISLGVDRAWFKEFLGDGNGILRCNYYPPCQEPDLVLGTGPHCDTPPLTVLQQDQDVGGLEVFADGKWQSLSPNRDAMVINIGDAFVAMSNGRYKSGLHRAVVNRYSERKSIAFFLCPRDDKVITPPPELGSSKYPDFKWRELLEFTQKQYRVDNRTLQSFTHWLQSNSSPG